MRPFSAVRHCPRRNKSLAAPGRGDAVTPPWPCLREVGLRPQRVGALAPRLRVLPLRSCLTARRVLGLRSGRLPPPVQLLFRGIGRGHPSGSVSRQTAPSKRFYAPPTFSVVFGTIAGALPGTRCPAPHQPTFSRSRRGTLRRRAVAGRWHCGGLARGSFSSTLLSGAGVAAYPPRTRMWSEA